MSSSARRRYEQQDENINVQNTWLRNMKKLGTGIIFNQFGK